MSRFEEVFAQKFKEFHEKEGRTFPKNIRTPLSDLLGMSEEAERKLEAEDLEKIQETQEKTREVLESLSAGGMATSDAVTKTAKIAAAEISSMSPEDMVNKQAATRRSMLTLLNLKNGPSTVTIAKNEINEAISALLTEIISEEKLTYLSELTTIATNSALESGEDLLTKLTSPSARIIPEFAYFCSELQTLKTLGPEITTLPKNITDLLSALQEREKSSREVVTAGAPAGDTRPVGASPLASGHSKTQGGGAGMG